MTKTAALQTFFSGFGIPAYPSASVPIKADYPYLTYEANVSAFDDGEQSITVNLWYYTDNEAIPNAKVQELSERIGMGGCVVACDGGSIWIKRGSPWCQSVVDANDTSIKRKYINISAEYLTLN